VPGLLRLKLHREWGRKMDRDYAGEFQGLAKILVEDINAYICHRSG
jgi:hypothetical protein